jgi:hypothetical protein
LMPTITAHSQSCHSILKDRPLAECD